MPLAALSMRAVPANLMRNSASSSSASVLSSTKTIVVPFGADHSLPVPRIAVWLAMVRVVSKGLGGPEVEGRFVQRRFWNN